MCHRCSLVLCSLNLPSHSCPSCSTPLTPNKQLLLGTLEAQLLSVLESEQIQRERDLEAKKRLQGAFPTLSATGPGSRSNLPHDDAHRQPPQAHKVLSLNPKTKKATVTSYTPTPSPPSSSVPSRAPSPGEIKELEDDMRRVGKPKGLTEVPHANPSSLNAKGASGWENLLIAMRVVYVPPPKIPSVPTGEGRSRRKKGKGPKQDVPGSVVATSESSRP